MFCGAFADCPYSLHLIRGNEGEREHFPVILEGSNYVRECNTGKLGLWGKSPVIMRFKVIYLELKYGEMENI